MSTSKKVPKNITQRAGYFISVHGHWLAQSDLEQYRAPWAEQGIPDTQIDRIIAYQRVWGGLALPPSPHYDGGPRTLSGDVEGPDPNYFWAGDQRTALPYSFMIGPRGEFGLHAGTWAPLHASVEGWVEALALADHARRCAHATTTLTGDAVDSLDLSAFEEVPEVAGLADTWWRGADSLIAVYHGEAEVLHAPRCRTATIYSGLDSWGLRGLDRINT
ncbi:hypothetical protein [Streptomyces xanthophaeus]